MIKPVLPHWRRLCLQSGCFTPNDFLRWHDRSVNKRCKVNTFLIVKRAGFWERREMMAKHWGGTSVILLLDSKPGRFYVPRQRGIRLCMSEEEWNCVAPRLQLLHLQNRQSPVPLTQRRQARRCTRDVFKAGDKRRKRHHWGCEDCPWELFSSFSVIVIDLDGRWGVKFCFFSSICKCFLNLEPGRSRQIQTSSLYSNSSWNSSGNYDPSSYLRRALWKKNPEVLSSGSDEEGLLWKRKQTRDAGEV